MDVDPQALAPAINRLKRAHGQLAAVLRMLEGGEDCRDVVIQLAAVSKALDRAGFALIATSLQECLGDVDGPDRRADLNHLERLFLSLA